MIIFILSSGISILLNNSSGVGLDSRVVDALDFPLVAVPCKAFKGGMSSVYT